MDANQEHRSNPFGMDEDCPNCPALVESRERVVHGYGDVGADFLFVGEGPSAGPDATGVPFHGDAGGVRLFDVLERLDLATGEVDEEGPVVTNAFLTSLTRCRPPERGPTDDEVRNCEPFLNAEVRMINPEVLVPVGARALTEVAREYTTRPADEFDVATAHATTVRGRGFELVPMVDLDDLDAARADAFVETFADLMDRDYRQTKGRRGR